MIAIKFGIGNEVFVIISALKKDEDYYVRANAAEDLGEIGDVRAVEPLTQALQDEDTWVRICAERALEKIQGK
jgi:HEAT repeat protein